MAINNSGRFGWKVKLTPSQIRHNLAVEIWENKYQVDYALLGTWEEKINFLKEILKKNKEKGGSSNNESQKALQGFIIKKLKYASDQQANASTVKGQEPQDTIQKNNSDNSIYNGITITIDIVNENPDKIRLFALRSFGESLYHSITDASLEFGYKAQ